MAHQHELVVMQMREQRQAAATVDATTLFQRHRSSGGGRGGPTHFGSRGKFHRDRPTDADTGAHSQRVFQVCKRVQTGKLSCKREEVPLVPEDVTLCALLSVYTSSHPSPCKTVTELCRRTTGKWNRALFSWSSRPRESTGMSMASYTECMWTRRFI